jgi:AAA+ superfamily predicted ATPase
VVAASNHPELLDRAVWRRFQIRLELPAPTQKQIAEWLCRFEKRTGLKLGMSPHDLAQSLKGSSFSEVEEFGTDVLRRIALDQPDADAGKITEQCLKQWQKRYTLKTDLGM